MARSYEKERQVYLMRAFEEVLFESLNNAVITIMDDFIIDGLDSGLAKKMLKQVLKTIAVGYRIRLK